MPGCACFHWITEVRIPYFLLWKSPSPANFETTKLCSVSSNGDLSGAIVKPNKKAIEEAERDAGSDSAF